MVFLDDADQEGALAYHDLTPDGMPQSKVFVLFKNGKWSELYGSKTKAKAFKNEDRRGHRSEARGRPLKRADVKRIRAARRIVAP
jgi:hypothetical protein